MIRVLTTLLLFLLSACGGATPNPPDIDWGGRTGFACIDATETVGLYVCSDSTGAVWCLDEATNLVSCPNP